MDTLYPSHQMHLWKWGIKVPTFLESFSVAGGIMTVLVAKNYYQFHYGGFQPTNYIFFQIAYGFLVPRT